jgi:hypothetical protein
MSSYVFTVLVTPLKCSLQLQHNIAHVYNVRRMNKSADTRSVYSHMKLVDS